MDAYEATRIVFSRIQSLDPENAAKIMGLLLIQDHGEKEMIRLAFGPETLVHSIVLKARKELGLLPPSTPSTPSSSPSPFSRQNSTSSRLLGGGGGGGNSSGLPSPSSWAPPPVFSRSNSTNGNGSNILSSVVDDLQNPEELMAAAAAAASSSPPFYGSELIDDFQLQDQLSFLNDSAGANSSPNSSIHGFPLGPKSGNADLFYSDIASECRSPSSNGGDSMLFPYMNWGGVNGHHRRSCSVADLYLSSEATGFGWKPCLYFARGYCKNGTSCRFQHGLPDDVSAAAAAAMTGNKMDAMVEQQCQELLLRSKSQRLSSVASSQLMASAASFPYAASAPSPTSGKCMNFLLQQQQQQNDRAAAAAAAALMLGGDESHKFFGRSRMDRYDYAGLVNPGSRQIYLTFPADSTFREEDVSNYFSIYGPVQDVRIPYQQKRMFGFVTFVYPETVKLILAKGNPHFVCDARVLVKPYKEKGKVPDKKLQQQQQQQHQSERGDFSGCTTPTGLDSRDPYDLQQLGARMLYNNSQEVLLRRKLEEQQQAAELQQAIEIQGRRFMGLQLLDLKNRNASLSSPSPIHTPTSITTPAANIVPSNHEEAPNEDKCSSPVTASAASATSGVEQNNKATVNAAASADKEESGGVEGSLNDDSDFQESAEHNLPDSPFASPTKSSFTGTSFSMVSEAMEMASSTNSSNAGSLLLGPSSLDMASIKSCFFPMPRFSSSGHGAVGL